MGSKAVFINAFVVILLVSFVFITSSYLYAEEGGQVRPGGEGGQPRGGGEGGQQGFTLPNPLGNTTSFAVIMEKLADIAIKIGLPLVVIFMIYAGFLFVSAGGNEDKITAAKTTFFWAIVGALLIIGSKALAIAIQNLAQKLN